MVASSSRHIEPLLISSPPEANTLHVSVHAIPASMSTPTVDTLHVDVHAVPVVMPIDITVDTLHVSVHAVTVRNPILTATLHVTVHTVTTSRVVATTLHVAVHIVPVRRPVQVSTLHVSVHSLTVGTAAYPGGFPPPFTYPGGFPGPAEAARRLVFHLLGRDGHDFGPVVHDRNRHFQHNLNDPGSGAAEVTLTNPLDAELKIGRILSAYVNGRGPVFDFLIEPGETYLLTAEEESTEGRLLGGRGTLAVFDECAIHPQRLAGPPVETTIVFDFSHPAYVPVGWVNATEIADQGNNPTPLWNGKPAQWTIPQAKWIWSSDGSAADAPGPATRFLRKTFAITPGKYVVRVAGDNAFRLSMNGTPVVSAGDLLKTTGAFWRAQRVPIDIPDGTNIFGAVAQNYAPTVPGANPAGFLFALTRVDTDGVEITTMFYSNSTWQIYPDLTDGAFPGITVGMVMIWIIEQAQAAGALAGVSYDFTALKDSNGNDWDLVPSITASVGDTPMVTFLKFSQAGLCDLRMEPGSPLKFQAFRYGEMIPVSTATFDAPHLRELRATDPKTVINAYLVRYDFGYFTIKDDASIAANGYHESFLTMGNLTADEALIVAQTRLALTKDSARSPITVKLSPDPSVAPYETYGVGSVVPTRTETGLSDERVMSISVADSTENADEIDVIPIIRDRILDEDDRLEQWLRTMANGTQSGVFQGASMPPPSSIPATALSNEGELIHLEGVVTVGPSPRHPIRRTGTARLFYLFLGGLLATGNVTVDCLIDDVVITTATIIAGQRRSPLITFDPPLRVIEHDDWWSMTITDGTDGTDLQGHLIIQ